MQTLSQYELEREANIARNRALLEELELKQAVEDIGIAKPKAKSTAKPVRAEKRKREKNEPEPPRRQSARLSNVFDPNESPEKRRKREEIQRAKAEEERLKAEEQARPRHQDLELSELMKGERPDEVGTLASQLSNMTHISYPRRVVDIDAYPFKDDKHAPAAMEELRAQLKSMKIISRAKVTTYRVYSCVYHPEQAKDLIFFGDKHGQLGIWDARVPPEEREDEDGDVAAVEDDGVGKCWHLQVHWPSTSKSSISNVKLDPVNAHNVYTSSYDQSVRRLSFTTGISQEVFYMEDGLICSIDLSLSGHDMWMSDSNGGITHLDLRLHKCKAQRYIVADAKIGCISMNPTRPNFLLSASNDRSLKIWDVRKLRNIVADATDAPLTPPTSSPGGPDTLPIYSQTMFDLETATEYIESKRGKGTLRGEWNHDKAVSSAYWDPQGRHIVSTSYDDKLRLWDFESRVFTSSEPFPTMRPFNRITHNCQTGRWLTVLRAQWSPNADVYPHFTIGNMDHSLNIFSCRGELIAKLSDRERVTAVQAVTASHPSIVERAVSGNASGRCVLWAPEGTEYS